MPEPETAQCGCSRETKSQRRTTEPRSSPSQHHDSVPPRQHPLVCTGAEPIHPVHDQLHLPAAEATPPNRDYIFAIFARFFLSLLLSLSASLPAFLPDFLSPPPFISLSMPLIFFSIDFTIKRLNLYCHF